MSRLRVAVIGAGAAGIAALRALHAAGIDATAFEKGDRIGGIWAMDNSSGLSPAYRTLHLNTSRARTEFASFPMPSDWPDFPGHERIADYFEAFVDRFGIRDRIRLETGVERAQRSGYGPWELSLDGGVREAFDAIVVANGHNHQPKLPDPPYPGEFPGEEMHAHDFRDNERFAGRRVMVVGMGNSAMDIAVESSWVAERTILSARSGTWIVPKYLLGRPADQIVRPAMTRLPWRMRQPLTEQILTRSVGRPETFGLQPPAKGFLRDHPTISDTILHRITHGEVVPRPGIERFDGGSVRFVDGTREEIDTIVWCTGYRVALPFLDEAITGPDPSAMPLYARVFHPQADGLYFVGLIQSTGSAIPICEQQGELVAEHLLGQYALPSARRMTADIERRRARNAKRYGEHARPHMRVDFDGYMRDIARERRRGRRRAARTGEVPPLAPRPARPAAELTASEGHR